MRMTKKVISAIAMAAMLTATVIPVTPVKAAPAAIAGYDFENGTGMSASGISGSTAPSVVNDAQRGNVLKLESGTSSRLLQKTDDPSLGDYDMKIDKGTPSSLKFTNPFAGKSLKGATIAFWIKVPDDTAANQASGVLGFISGNKTVEHPDKIYVDPATGKTDPDKQHLEPGTGPYMFGITAAYCSPLADSENPIVYFAGLHHNTYNLNDFDGVFKNKGGQWQYVVVTMNNSFMKVYVNGSAVELDEYKNKRWNDGEKNHGSPGNVGQYKFLEFLSWSDTEGYIGYTGFSPTSEMYLDDITFYDSELSAGDVTTLYQAAQSGGTTTNVGNGGGGSSTKTDEAKKEAERKAREEAERIENAAREANKALTDALVSSVKVSGMKSAAPSVSGIYRGTDTYTSVQYALNGVVLRDGYRLYDFVAVDVNFGGTQPEAVAKVTMDVPSGYSADTLVVARINDDGTVSILKHTIENGKIVAKTNHFSKYAVVQLEPGTPGSASSNLPKTGAISAVVVVGIGAVSTLSGAALLKRRKDEE